MKKIGLLLSTCLMLFGSCSGCSSDSESVSSSPETEKPVSNDVQEDNSQLIANAEKEGYLKGYELGEEDALNHDDKNYSYEGCDDYSGDAYDAYRKKFEEGYDIGYEEGLKELHKQESQKQEQLRQRQLEQEREQQRINESHEQFHQGEIENAYKNGYSVGKLWGNVDRRNGDPYGSTFEDDGDFDPDPDINRAHSQGLKEGYHNGYYGR